MLVFLYIIQVSYHCYRHIDTKDLVTQITLHGHTYLPPPTHTHTHTPNSQLRALLLSVVNRFWIFLAARLSVGSSLLRDLAMTDML